MGRVKQYAMDQQEQEYNELADRIIRQAGDDYDYYQKTMQSNYDLFNLLCDSREDFNSHLHDTWNEFWEEYKYGWFNLIWVDIHPGFLRKDKKWKN